MSDPVGTVRRSPDGIVAVKTDKSTQEFSWLVSRAVVNFNHWRSDDDVADWTVVYRPPTPESKLIDIGTVLGKYQRGEWSEPTALAAIIRIHVGTLILMDERKL